MSDTEERQAGQQLFKQIASIRSKDAEIESLRGDLASVKRALISALDTIDMAAKPFTGWAVLVRKNGDAWEALGCIDTNNWPDEIPEFEAILPIPRPDALPDWNGP